MAITDGICRRTYALSSARLSASPTRYRCIVSFALKVGVEVDEGVIDDEMPERSDQLLQAVQSLWGDPSHGRIDNAQFDCCTRLEGVIGSAHVEGCDGDLGPPALQESVTGQRPIAAVTFGTSAYSRSASASTSSAEPGSNSRRRIARRRFGVGRLERVLGELPEAAAEICQRHAVLRLSRDHAAEKHRVGACAHRAVDRALDRRQRLAEDGDVEYARPKRYARELVVGRARELTGERALPIAEDVDAERT